MHIREWQPSDTPAIQSLVRDTLSEYGFDADPEHSEADIQDIRRAYFDAGGAFFVLIDDREELAGTIGFIRIESGTCKLRKMYVARRHRGRGFGRLLLQHALTEVAKRGYQRVILETTKRMTEAVALYEATGFSRVDRVPDSPRCDTTYALRL